MASGGAALAVDPQAGAAPAAAPEPTPAATPAEGTKPAEGTTPASPTPAEGETKPPSLAPAPVPYGKFRETETQLTRTRREYEKAQKQWEAERGKYTEIEKQAAQLRQELEDFKALEEVIRANPELTEQINTMLGRGSRTAKPQTLELPPEIVQKLGKLDTLERVLVGQQEAQQRQQQELMLQRTEGELKGVVTKILADRKWASPDKIIPLAMNYVLDRVSDMEDARMEDVPALLADFLLPLEEEFHQRMQGYVKGKVEDGRQPAVPGGPSSALGVATKMGANDDTTAKTVEQLLKEKLGWRNGED